MPTCKSCGQQWSWKETLVKALKFNSGSICSGCEAVQFVTASTRRKSSTLAAMMVIVQFLIVQNLNMSLLGTVGLIIVAVCLVILVMPFLVELTDSNEPLW